MKLELINKRFDDNLIKSRRGNYGRELIYVATPEYIKRLNEIFDHNWQWTIERADQIGDSIVVEGILHTECGTRSAFGGAQIKFKRGTKDPVAIADDYKAAASDALKKACSLLGIGLHLWEDEDCEPQENGLPTPPIKGPTIDELSHLQRVERVYDAFRKYSVGRDELEKVLDKLDVMWGEEEFNKLRGILEKFTKAPKDSNYKELL